MINDVKQYVLAPRDLAATHCRAADAIEAHCRHLETSQPRNLGEHGAMYISSAILRAFSIELALKSLYYVETASCVRGHNLESLFTRMTAESQGRIASAANANLKRPLADVLKDTATLFEDWRYVHEKLGSGDCLNFDTEEMRAVAHAVLEVLDAKINAIDN